MSTPKRDSIPHDFTELSISLASPERILDWSYGEVTKPETINYRTQRPEKCGLFDEKIFGPERDYECYCGKYRGIRFKGIVCEKCGVEITRAIVRRERMGHIDLATPVAHIWYLRNIPSRIALLLGLSSADVEKVVYFAGYIVTSVNTEEKNRLLKDLERELEAKVKAANNDNEKLRLKNLAQTAKKDIDHIVEGIVLDEAAYHLAAVKYGAFFEATIGAEALYNILKALDLEALQTKLLGTVDTAPAADRDKIRRRLALIETMIRANVRPEWMFLTRLPVVPPALRPMVALEGGRHASSDLNDLYRRVINRNNRLKKLLSINAPEVILRNEKRILQEAVDALLDNSIRRGGTSLGVLGARRRELKSLADYLKGKHGYLRQNLLGKRVDYSGRSVIVVGPELELDQCGLPKHMALELFRPFVIAGLLERELAYNIRGAGRLIEDGIPEVWAILEDVIKDRHVLLNRAPTLHRQSFQAFRPKLIEGNAIQLHPLVCPAFNADFDGDQMAVHVPLTPEAQWEAREIISANKNVLKPGSGDVITEPRQDVILGCYWMTQEIPGSKGEGKAFPSPNAAITAYDFGDVDFRAKVKILPSDNVKYAQFEGKVFETTVGRLLFNSSLPNDFPYINEEMTKKRMSKTIHALVKLYSLDGIPKIVDKIKTFGFTYATKAGITFSHMDALVPDEKAAIVKEGQEVVAELWQQYNNGLLTEHERYQRVIEAWTHVSDRIRKALMESLDPTTPVHNMVTSGARGSSAQLHQMAGMKGIITDPRGNAIEFPIIASMKEGLTPIEYFISTHGSRKGLADTALNTARAGYLTRRLFDVAQDVVILEKDCGTKESIPVKRPGKDNIGASFAERLSGRVLAEGVLHFKRNHLLTPLEAQEIENSDTIEVAIRSPMTCTTMRGVCAQCYGVDLSTQELVDLGEAVGVVAAQAIGEPGTQLTMRTFHAGGVAAAGGDITMGLPRVEEVFERRKPKVPAVVARVSGIVTSIAMEDNEHIITITPDSGRTAKRDTEYSIHPARVISVKLGDSVEKGQFMTDGPANIEDVFEYGGKARAQEYIIDEVTRIYELQGASFARKHLELIVKQMFSRVEITSAGDTSFSANDVVEDFEFERANRAAKEAGGELAKGHTLVLGIAEVALSRSSFLSSVSFQHATRKLVEASLSRAVDRLVGLKENVIIGRLIPAGTGFPESKKSERIKKMQEELYANMPEEDERPHRQFGGGDRN
ncbi:DNA-directed RNA polymerase subunit beta' [Candidatus Kaiserbacteria bacterium]|nr:DNA-directed RNA polymerase subunit beta' [Candidatus Kaiserbacteria bacterium]